MKTNDPYSHHALARIVAGMIARTHTENDLFAYAVERMKYEIRDDVSLARVPRDVASFGDLHDHVDANEYGGFCEDAEDALYEAALGGREDDDTMSDRMCAFFNRCQDAAHDWIAKGGLRATIMREFFGVPVKVINTGGGCTALYGALGDDGAHFLITAGYEAHAYEGGPDWYVGFYNANGDEIAGFPSRKTDDAAQDFTARRFVAWWDNGAYHDAKPEEVTAAFFSDDRGYDTEYLLEIMALKVGETWANHDHGFNSHTITRVR